MGGATSNTERGGQPSRRRKLLFSLLALSASLGACLLLAEAILRLAGFSYELRASVVQGADAADLYSRYDGCDIDRDLIWAPKSYAERLEHALAVQPDVLFAGDSCTELGSYDRDFVELVSAAFPGRTIRGANVGVTGWSTQQGLQQMRRDVSRIRPRVVTIYFGWNDHWNSVGLTDKEVMEFNASPLFHLHALRLMQLFTRGYVGWQRLRQSQLPLRVPLQNFRENLAEMVNLAREIGAVPVLLTAPEGHQRGHEPEQLAGRWITDLSQLIPLHREYAEAVRAVAREKNAVLCDLAAEFEKLPPDVVHDELFQPDGVHLTNDGDRQIAGFLFRCFQENGLFERLLE